MRVVTVVTALWLAGLAGCSNHAQDQCDKPPKRRESVLLSTPIFPVELSLSKTWRFRRVLDGVFTAGQLSDRDVKMAADAGFRTVISLLTQPPERRRLVEAVAGMAFVDLGFATGDWLVPDNVRATSRALAMAQKPILLHCQGAVSSTLHALLHAAMTSRGDQPRPDLRRIIAVTNSLSLDFVNRFKMAQPLMENITGDSFPKEPQPEPESEPEPEPESEPGPEPEPEPEDGDEADTESYAVPPPIAPALAGWVAYWPAFPVHGRWAVAGQIRSTDLDQIKEAGYTTIVNLQLSGGNVELLNMDDSGSVLSASRPAEFADFPGSAGDNYDAENPLQWGAGGDYNAEAEKAAVFEKGMTAIHAPWAGDESYFEMLVSQNIQTLLYNTRGPVLVHCRGAGRAVYVGVLMAAVEGGLPLSWALGRVEEATGKVLSPSSLPEIYKVYCMYLSGNQHSSSIPTDDKGPYDAAAGLSGGGVVTVALAALAALVGAAALQ